MGKAGVAGLGLAMAFELLFGDSKLTIIAIVLSLFGTGMVYVRSYKKVGLIASLLAILSLVIGVSGLAANLNLVQLHRGAVGLTAGLLVSFFGLLVSNIVFAVFVAIAVFIFMQFVWQELPKEAEEEKKPVINFGVKTPPDNVKIRGVEEQKPEPKPQQPKISLFKKDGVEKLALLPAIVKGRGKYQLPPVDLLNKNESAPTSGNIKENSMIIKKTLENFGIPVEMAEVNVGPAVTQYAFKPAEGVKLSKITTLSNNLALALAAHPIRIEAPIPGKS
ncbi:MAG: DNA translocase FtsK, partial [Candidatus Saccharimonadales bacterium]